MILRKTIVTMKLMWSSDCKSGYDCKASGVELLIKKWYLSVNWIELLISKLRYWWVNDNK